MSEHYYSEKPITEEKSHQWKTKINGRELTFTSVSGVFSKNELDFGSRLLCEQFISPEINGDLLDLGCGYGPIGISLAKDNPERQIDMVDINERAVKYAEKNLDENNVQNAHVFVSDGFSQVDESKLYAAIITNPPIRVGKQFIYRLFEKSREYLLAKGELWIVIQKKQGAASAIKYLKTIFESVEVVEKKKGYFIIRSIKH